MNPPFSQTASSPRDLTDPRGFAFWTRDVVRFSDVDRYGHINNIATATYCETGRVAFAEALWPGSTAGQASGWVIAKLVVNFLAQAHHPGEVSIGTRVDRVGRSSCTIGQGLFKGGTCFASSEAVLVWLDIADGGRAVPFPPELAERLRHEVETPFLTAQP